jgi:hypothetical protein
MVLLLEMSDEELIHSKPPSIIQNAVSDFINTLLSVHCSLIDHYG